MFSHLRVVGGTSLTGVPVSSAQHTTVGLHNIQSQVENNTGLSLPHMMDLQHNN